MEKKIAGGRRWLFGEKNKEVSGALILSKHRIKLQISSPRENSQNCK